MVQGRVDQNPAHAGRAQHLGTVYECRFAPVVLEMAMDGEALKCATLLPSKRASSGGAPAAAV